MNFVKINEIIADLLKDMMTALVVVVFIYLKKKFRPDSPNPKIRKLF